MKAIPALILSALFCSTVKAELLGVVDGRGARLSQHSSLSVDLGLSWYTPQSQWAAARINVKPAAGLLTYFDVAQMQGNHLPVTANRQSNFSGTGFGGGLLFSLPKWFNRIDLAFKLAYHSAILNESNRKDSFAYDNIVSATGQAQTSLELSQWSADVVVSPIDPLFENGISWYATAGFFSTNARLKMRVDADDASRFVDYRTNDGVVVGVGVLKPSKASSRAQWYAGFKWLAGEPLLGVGVRYDLR